MPHTLQLRAASRIKYRLLVPLIAGIAALLAVFVLLMLTDFREDSQRDARTSGRQVQHWIAAGQENAVAELEGTGAAIMNNREVADAFARRDRARLLALEAPLFQQLHAREGVTHFYFHLPDRTVLLRLHAPQLAGDKIDRESLLAAEKTGQPAAALEHGVTGVFTLRVVMPWRLDSRLLGYLELGIENEWLLRQIHGLAGHSLRFVAAVDKRLLDRSLWDKAHQDNPVSDWNRFPTVAISDTTEHPIPAPVEARLATLRPSSDMTAVVTRWEHRMLQMVFLPLNDLGGHRKGELVVLEDVTDGRAEVLENMGWFTLVCGLVGAGLVVLFWILLSRIEAELVTSAAKLQVEVAEHRRTEQALRAAKEAAEGATRAKSAFLANMSHEIRTPMNGILGMTGLLLDTKLDVEQRQCADSVRTCAENLMGIINDILDFSKIEAGKLHLERIDFDPREPVQATIELFAQPAAARGIRVALTVNDDVPTGLRGDPGRLRQVLTNLVGNAVKFTERGQVTVGVSVARETDGTVVLRHEIRDTGIGISPEVQARLFQSFQQADSSTTRRYGGTGLGLAISKQLVALMHGEIGLESAPGAGTTFWFTAEFERTPSNGNAPAAALAGPAAAGANGRPAAAGHVLVAEDNVVNQRIAVAQLAKLGWTADVVANGHGVLEALRRDRYDVVLMDCQMPELDGYETTRLIRRQEADPATCPWRGRVVIIAMTAHAMRGDRENCLAAGMDDYLSKPTRIGELRAALERCGPVRRA